MRPLIGLLLVAALGASDVARLEELVETRQLFLLREALQQRGWNTADTLLYRGIVESHFGQERKAIEDLTRFLAGRPSPAQRRTAYDELAAALARVGQYAAANRNVTEALRLSPEGERADKVNTQHLYAAVAGVPPQSMALEKDVPVRATFNELGSWNVPVDVNGQRGEWIFDTGANWSTLSAGEAARLGLATRESDVTVGGSTGKQNALRLTVVPDLRLGRARVKNVIFLVLSDESLYVGPLKYQIRGILGMPVLRALGRVGITANGDLRIEPERTERGAPNLFLDGWSAIVDVRHGERRTRMFLDSGANVSLLYRSFRPALTADEIAGLAAKEEQVGGAGEVITRKTEAVPMLRLFVSGQPLDLSDISLLATEPQGDARYRDGVIGADGLRGGFTLDFRAMRLILD